MSDIRNPGTRIHLVYHAFVCQQYSFVTMGMSSLNCAEKNTEVNVSLTIFFPANKCLIALRALLIWADLGFSSNGRTFLYVT